jgi:predicted Rdx family selenoprotein
MEQLGGGRREAADAKVVIEEDRRDLGGFEEVAKVAVRARQVADPDVQLGVDRLKLLVDRLELLL